MIRVWRRRSLDIVLVCLLAIGGLPARSMANGASDRSAFLVSVFDCYMPVPVDFVLNTHDKSAIAFFLGDPSEVARIVISEYKKDLGASFTLVRDRHVGALAVEELRSSLGKDLPVTRIHDQKQQVIVYGGREELVESLVQGCINKKRGDLFTE